MNIILDQAEKIIQAAKKKVVDLKVAMNIATGKRENGCRFQSCTYRLPSWKNFVRR